jgi:RNA polymerase sigma factor (sigma-70 family)
MTPLLSNPLLRTQSDTRLTALAAAGHDHAFEAIVERYRKPLSRYLRRLLSEPLAEDVLQATFVRAWQALGSGTDVRELRPWLYRIAHNQAVNALRAAGPAESELPQTMAAPQAVAAPDLAAERSETLRSTLRGIGDLPDRQRAALVAVAVDDRPHADVAAELGLSDGALRQLLLRARTTLRAAATALTPYPVVSWLSAGSEVSAARVARGGGRRRRHRRRLQGRCCGARRRRRGGGSARAARRVGHVARDVRDHRAALPRPGDEHDGGRSRRAGRGRARRRPWRAIRARR